MVAAELTAYVFVDCWFTRRSMGITNFGLETPEYWKTWSAIPVVALRRRNLLPLEKFWRLENSCYEYTTLERIYCRLLLVHLRELRWPLIDSDCTNACAFNGLPGPMRHWLTSFIHFFMLSLLNEAARNQSHWIHTYPNPFGNIRRALREQRNGRIEHVLGQFKDLDRLIHHARVPLYPCSTEKDEEWPGPDEFIYSSGKYFCIRHWIWIAWSQNFGTGQWEHLGFGMLKVSAWLNYRMLCTTYGETIFSMIPRNWGPLAILNITYKILSRIVFKRVKPILDVQQCKAQHVATSVIFSSVRSYVVGFAMHLLSFIMAKGGGLKTTKLMEIHVVSRGGRVTRMCLESAVVPVCSGSGLWVLASEGWKCWRGFSGWHAYTLGSKIRRRYSPFCKKRLRK